MSATTAKPTKQLWHFVPAVRFVVVYDPARGHHCHLFYNAGEIVLPLVVVWGWWRRGWIGWGLMVEVMRGMIGDWRETV